MPASPWRVIGQKWPTAKGKTWVDDSRDLEKLRVFDPNWGADGKHFERQHRGRRCFVQGVHPDRSACYGFIN